MSAKHREPRELFETAVRWIALNDNAGHDVDAQEIEGWLSTALVADTFGKTTSFVAGKVWLARRREARAAKECAL